MLNLILGGMWRFYNEPNRDLAKKNFKKIAGKYLKNGIKTKRGPDQFFLNDHVYPLIKSQSIIHDSYCCVHYGDSKPFPTERVGSCFIGSVDTKESCAENKRLLPEGPMVCRPTEHKDWTRC